jgi:hypothetical protein
MVFGVRLVARCCASVLQTKYSTPCNCRAIMLFTANAKGSARDYEVCGYGEKLAREHRREHERTGVAALTRCVATGKN